LPNVSQSVAEILNSGSRVPSNKAKGSKHWNNRVSEGEQESERRLKSVIANDLVPARNVTNYINAFKEHALAIGIVGGIHQAISDAENSLSNHGPRLNGVYYSDEHGRFHTPHSLLTYVNGSRSGKGNAKHVAIQDKSIPDAPYALKIYSSDQDLNPVGGQASIANPATRVLAFDFDKKHHEARFIKDEVISLCEILHNAGMYNWIVDSSTTGYHVLVMLNRPVLLNDVSVLFKGIQNAFVTLDVQPMTFSGGAISIPFSLGKTKDTRRLLAHKRSEDFIYQRKINRATEWHEISDALVEGIRTYDRANLRSMHYDQNAVRLADHAMELWNNSVSIKHGSKSRVAGDYLRLENNHLGMMATKSYNSASEERFSIAGAMMTIYGFSEDALEDSVKRLINSSDPLPAKYRELIRNSSGKVTLHRAARKDLISAREKSNRVRGWVGLINGSSFSKVAVSDDLEFTPEARGLIRLLLDEKDKEKALNYTQLAVLRSYIQFANARHHEHLNAIERGLEEIPDNPFAAPVPFALSMVTRLTGLAHGTAYAHTMSCSAGLSDDDDFISVCRASGQERGLFCNCHKQWEPYFAVSHLGHAGENDENNRADECRDHSFCTSEGCESRVRTSTFVQFKINVNNELNDEHLDSWMYRYLASRDPIFNESALGSAGFHMYTVISESSDRVFLRDLEEDKLEGAGVTGTIARLMEAGLVGRHSRRGRFAFLISNTVDDGSLAYRLRHERRLHAADQKVGFRSAMMGTGDITQFVLAFASDTVRLHSLAQEVLNFTSASDEHAPAQLRDPDGGVVTSVAEFCRAHGLPMPPRKIAIMQTAMVDGHCDLSQKTQHSFSYMIDEAEERKAPEHLFDNIHRRDDFLSTAEQLEAFERYVFGSDFVPSNLLSEMFLSRHKEFLFIQECIAEREQLEND
jgi:hypothetical protein